MDLKCQEKNLTKQNRNDILSFVCKENSLTGL